MASNKVAKAVKVVSKEAAAASKSPANKADSRAVKVANRADSKSPVSKVAKAGKTADGSSL